MVKVPSRSVVAVSGTIGAGKSTLVSALAGSPMLLASTLPRRAVPFREPVADNPYLEDFYRDPARWAFAAQVFMISHRFNAACPLRDRRHAKEGTDAVELVEIHDRCFHEDRVFAEVNHRIGNISERDWETYLKLYDSFCSVVPLPDVIVYLRLDPEVALRRIQERGREEEAGISQKYLRMLHEAYEGWVLQMQTSPGGAARCVVVDASQTKGEVYQQVLEKLNGLGPL